MAQIEKISASMAKWIFSNGSRLEVRDVGPVMFVMTPKMNYPLPAGVNEVMSDGEARAYLEDLKNTGRFNTQSIQTKTE